MKRSKLLILYYLIILFQREFLGCKNSLTKPDEVPYTGKIVFLSDRETLLNEGYFELFIMDVEVKNIFRKSEYDRWT